MTPEHADFDDILATSWRELVTATRDRTAFTLGFLGTVGVDGTPQVRAVILRRAEPEASSLYFATDAKSRKVPEITANPRVAMTFYDEAAGVQLRASGTADIVDAEAERTAVWDGLDEHSREMYQPEPGADGTAFDNFRWVRIQVDGLDRLDLSGAEHLRWKFARAEDSTGSWRGQAVAP